MSKILIDLNRPKFQQEFFELQKDEKKALLNTLKKMSKLEWTELYVDKGIRWELIESEKSNRGNNLYSFRFSQKYRGTAFRDGDYLVLLGLFPDYDSAYK